MSVIWLNVSFQSTNIFPFRLSRPHRGNKDCRAQISHPTASTLLWVPLFFCLLCLTTGSRRSPGLGHVLKPGFNHFPLPHNSDSCFHSTKYFCHKRHDPSFTFFPPVHFPPVFFNFNPYSHSNSFVECNYFETIINTGAQFFQFLRTQMSV